MFPSSNSYIAVPYTDQAMFDKPFDNDVSPYSKNPLPSSFFEFSPFVDPNDDDIEYFQHHHHDLFMSHFPKHHHHPPLITSSDTIAETEINTTASNKINNNNFMDETAKKSFPMAEQMLKKSVKKDRHSKIATAQGLRDRRMRLSLEVAHKFFSLQDMLGYDKASKTIEWLFTKSKVAIRELYRELSQTKNSCNHGNKSVSSTSECEVVSGIEDIANNEDEKAFEGKFSTGICKEKRARNSRKPKFHPLARESRAKARARARERTMEKRWNKSQLCPKATTLDELNQLGSSSPLETGEESGSHSHDMKSSSLEVVAEVEEPSSHSLECQGPMDNMVEESFVITSKLSPSTIFDYHHEIAISHGMNPNFTENWDIDTTRSQYSFSSMTNLMRPSTGNIQECIPSPFSLTSSETRFQSQFADIQYKPWEIYNNQSLSRP